MSIAPPTPSKVVSSFPLIVIAPAGLIACRHCCTRRIDMCHHHCIIVATARIDPCHHYHCCCHCPWCCCLSFTPVLLSCHPPPDCLASLASRHLPPASLASSPAPSSGCFVRLPACLVLSITPPLLVLSNTRLPPD